MHALAELIERDAMTLQSLATDYAHLPNVVSLIAGPPRGAQPEDLCPSPASWYPFVEHSTLPVPLRAVVEQIKQSGVWIDLRWIASDVRLAVFQCVIHEQAGQGMSLTHAGSGAHPDAGVAAKRAITEAVQSRATYIQGVREDLRHPAVRPQSPPGGGWFAPEAPRVPFSELPSYTFTDIVDDLRYTAQALQEVGLRDILAVDLSHPDMPFPVVRVIVPGLEAPLDFGKRDRVALGWRARRIFNRSTLEAAL